MMAKDLLVRGWEHAYEKEDWYPPLKDALNNVTAAQASWRPEGVAANTIWENVNHLVYYKKRLLEQLQGEKPDHSASDNDDTFQTEITHGSEEDWSRTVADLRSVHQQIAARIASLSEEDVDKPLSKLPAAFGIHSIILHDAFHTGQIVQIRKLQGSWPTKRSFD